MLFSLVNYVASCLVSLLEKMVLLRVIEWTVVSIVEGVLAPMMQFCVFVRMVWKTAVLLLRTSRMTIPALGPDLRTRWVVLTLRRLGTPRLRMVMLGSRWAVSVMVLILLDVRLIILRLLEIVTSLVSFVWQIGRLLVSSISACLVTVSP